MDKGDVSRTLCGLGLLPSSVCYFYMAEALRLSLREPDRLLLVTKHVYPDVARCFDTNWKCVERGLRRAAAGDRRAGTGADGKDRPGADDLRPFRPDPRDAVPAGPHRARAS